MSFMFHPYPYVDHDAVNPVTGEGVRIYRGAIATAKKICDMLKEGKNVGIDAYPGAEVETLVNVIRQNMGGQEVLYVDADALLKDGDEIAEMLKPYLPEDRDMDPVLLYGRRYKGGYAGLQDADNVDTMKEILENQKGVLVYGRGSLAPELQGAYDVRIWMDITPRTAALNFKYGKARNLGG